jgi:hypothetical protein
MSIQFCPYAPTIHISFEVWSVIQRSVQRDTISDQVMVLVVLCKYGWLVPKTDYNRFVSDVMTPRTGEEREPQPNQLILSSPTRKLCFDLFSWSSKLTSNFISD